MRHWLSLAWAAAFLYALHVGFANAATPGPLSLSDNAAEGSIDRYVTYVLEKPGTPKQRYLAAASADEFKPIGLAEADFGYQRSAIWLRVLVDNPHSSAQRRVLMMHTNFMQEADAYLVTYGDGATQAVTHLLSQSPMSTFETRPIAFHQLAAIAEFPAGSQSALYVRYRSEGSTAMPLSLETELSFAQTASRGLTVDFGFYGVMAMFLVASLAGMVMSPNTTFLAYFFYAGSVLLYIFQRDGYAFQYLWPGAPEWNNFASLPTGLAPGIFASLFTRTYLNTSVLSPRIDQLLLVLTGLLVINFLYGVFIDPMYAKKIAVLSITASTLIFLGIGIYAYRKLGLRTIFFLIGWLGIVLASLMMSAAHWFDLTITRAATLDSMRIAMVFDAFMMGIATVSVIVVSQRDRDALNVQRIDALDANLRLHKRLATLEQKYNLSRTIAETSHKQLANTSHDLRQPLFALRSAIAGLSGQASTTDKQPAAPANLEEIESSLTYMEELIEASLEKATDRGESGGTGLEGGSETVPAQQILDTLGTMFNADASQKDIDLRIIACSQSLFIPCIPVLRMASNLISNAIRYAPGARILVGMRRDGDAIRLEIHDTGPGMPEKTLKRITKRHERGPINTPAKGLHQQSKGLGLDIVNSIAVDHGLHWRLDSTAGKGTVGRITLPLAPSKVS